MSLSYGGAPDGWDSPRFLGLVLSYGSCPFSSLSLPSRTPKGHNIHHWAADPGS